MVSYRKSIKKRIRLLSVITAFFYWTFATLPTFGQATNNVSPEKLFAAMISDRQQAKDKAGQEIIFEYIKNEFQCENVDKASVIYNAYRNAAKNLKITQRSLMPTPIKQCEQFFLNNLIKKSRIIPGLDNSTHAGTPLVSSKTYGELELNQLAQSLEVATQTGYGSLAFLAYKPLADQEKILKRQALVKKFYDNSALYTNTRSHLSKIHDYEQIFFNPLFDYSEHYFLKNYPLRTVIEFITQFVQEKKEIAAVKDALGSSTAAAELGFGMTLFHPILDMMFMHLVVGIMDPASISHAADTSSNLISKAGGILYSQAQQALNPLGLQYDDGKNPAESESRTFFASLNQQSIPNRAQAFKKYISNLWENMDKDRKTWGYSIPVQLAFTKWIKRNLSESWQTVSKESSTTTTINRIDKTVSSYVKNTVETIAGAFGYAEPKKTAEFMADNKAVSALSTAKGIGASYGTFIHFYKTYQQTKEGFIQLAKLRIYLQEVLSFTTAVKDLSRTIATDPLTEPYADKIVDIMTDPLLKEFIDLINTPTFKGHSKFFHLHGRVIRAMYLLEKVRPLLVKMAAIVGEVDVYCSLATLLKDQSGDTRFSFAHFIDAATPVINSENMWMASALKTKPVTNTVSLGLEPDNASIKSIITGPTGAGKTVFLRSVGHLVALTHTFGIGPADSITISFFDSIATCFPSKESQRAGESRFMTSQKNMNDIEKFLQEKRTAKTVILIDEPYSGTTESHRAILTYNFGASIQDLSSTMCLLATHVHKPTELEVDTKGIFKNCQPEIIEESVGVFSNTFKILPGAAMWWFTEQDKVTRYNDWLSTRINN